MKLKTTVLISFIFALAGLGLVFYLGKANPDVNIPGVRYFSHSVSLPSFHLQDQNKNPFGVKQLKGHWSILFFGYTHCPDVCPTALQDLSNLYAAMEELEGKTPDLNMVFVSVDPQRDTPELLKEYLDYFGRPFFGVTGAKEEIDKLANRVGAIYEFEDSKSGDPIRDSRRLKEFPGYLVNHYSAFILLNPDAEMVAHIHPPHDTDRVMQILNIIQSS